MKNSKKKIAVNNNFNFKLELLENFINKDLFYQDPACDDIVKKILSKISELKNKTNLL